MSNTHIWTDHRGDGALEKEVTTERELWKVKYVVSHVQGAYSRRISRPKISYGPAVDHFTLRERERLLPKFEKTRRKMKYEARGYHVKGNGQKTWKGCRVCNEFLSAQNVSFTSSIP